MKLLIFIVSITLNTYTQEHISEYLDGYELCNSIEPSLENDQYISDCIKIADKSVFHKNALNACETINAYKHIPKCLKVIKKKNFKSHVTSFCSNFYLDHYKISCLKKAGGKNFDPEALKICSKITDEDEKLRCFNSSYHTKIRMSYRD